MILPVKLFCCVIGWLVQPIHALITQIMEHHHMEHPNKSGDDRGHKISSFVILGFYAEDLSCEMTLTLEPALRATGCKRKSAIIGA